MHHPLERQRKRRSQREKNDFKGFLVCFLPFFKPFKRFLPFFKASALFAPNHPVDPYVSPMIRGYDSCPNRNENWTRFVKHFIANPSQKGVLLACCWLASGMLLACSWHAPGMLLACSWRAAGMLLACSWHASVACSWHASGTALMCI